MKRHRRKFNGRNARGFTFLEVIVVVAILLLLATIIGIRYVGRAKEAKVDTTKIQLKEVEKALEIYRLDNGNYPTQEQGLIALFEKPEDEPVPKKWKQYMDDIPNDAWGNEFIYIIPGEHKDFDLYSKGPDGSEETEDDIVNWKKETEEE
ncbi:MAG: type II secretion system major pseudopilin GspG [Candidatus Eremiobacteraeota bacterium]|nr:type II secretion system major pseudopilin GspG [Candidatus Eremiobacteraeota bacterium]